MRKRTSALSQKFDTPPLTYARGHANREEEISPTLSTSEHRGATAADSQRASGAGASVSCGPHGRLGGEPCTVRLARGTRSRHEGDRPGRRPRPALGPQVAHAVRSSSIERPDRHASRRAPRPVFPPMNGTTCCRWRAVHAPNSGVLARTGPFGPWPRRLCNGTSCARSARARSSDG